MSIVAAICYSPDWAAHVAVEVHSLQKTNPGTRIYLVSDTTGRLSIPGCVFIDVERLFHERIPSTVNVSTRFTRYALYRLLIPEIIPEDRVLYLDADTIVDKPLHDLWELDLDRDLIAGAVDIGITEAQRAAIGFKYGDPYVNAGVLMMDLRRIREEGVAARWLEEINTVAYTCHDQDVINKTCRGRVAVVSNAFNSSESTGYHPDPVVAHFAGPAASKPWASERAVHFYVWKRWADDYEHSTAPSHMLVRSQPEAPAGGEMR
jgi:lipopolysaccharide biosynthesis glycosyltransferase